MRISARASGLVCLLGICGSASALSCTDLNGAYVFAQDPETTYLGFFGSEFASQSIMNTFGEFGSEFRSNSVRNPFGAFGSSTRTYSATNPFTTTPPVIARDGEFVAFLTANPIANPAVSLETIDAECETFSATSPASSGQPTPPPIPPLSGGDGGGGPANPPYVDFGFSGLWWNQQRSGEGVNLDFGVAGNQLLLLFTWYTFTPEGLPIFVTGFAPLTQTLTSASFDVSISAGGTFGPNFDSADVETVPLGRVTLDFLSCSNVRFTVDPILPGFVGYSTELVRFLPRQPDHTCVLQP